MLDVGASIGADAEQLVDLAVMGAATARILFGIDRPSVGPAQYRRRRGQRPRTGARGGPHPARGADCPDLDYLGFVEGDDIGKGTVDVVVTEGFAGNIALKTAEGTARQIGEYLRGAMTRRWARGSDICSRGRRSGSLRERMDPRRANGGVFLGLNGIVIKSHGGTDAEGFAAAIELGHGVVRDELLAKITAALGAHPARPRGRRVGGAAS